MRQSSARRRARAPRPRRARRTRPRSSRISPARPFSTSSRTKFGRARRRSPSDLLEHVGLHPRLDLGVRRAARASSGTSSIAAREVLELLADRVEPALLLRGLEERAGIDAVRGGYERLASSCEKSISASASSIRRCWSASVSVLRVIFSAASEREARDRLLDLGRAPARRLLDLPLGLLEAALAVLLGLRRASARCCASAILRASARIPSASPSPGRSAPCALRAGRAPRRGRGRPPRPTARIRSRRSSISFWIGPNA